DNTVSTRAAKIVATIDCTTIQAIKNVSEIRSARTKLVTTALTSAQIPNKSACARDSPTGVDAAHIATAPVLPTGVPAANTAKSSRKSTFGLSSPTAAWRDTTSLEGAPLASHD